MFRCRISRVIKFDTTFQLYPAAQIVESDLIIWPLVTVVKVARGVAVRVVRVVVAGVLGMVLATGVMVGHSFL